jgi:sugar/nucleoside kinase (ribokinase family)
MTIYGQISIDHIVDINHLLRLGPAKEIFTIGDDGELIFTEGSYLETDETYIPWFFGPLGVYSKDKQGGKYWVTEVARFGGRIRGIIQQGLVRELGIPIKDLGGGGPNNIKLLYQVFANFPIQFIGTYRRKSVEEREADNWEFALKSMVTKLDLVPLHEHPPINICFEGVGPKMDDRIILRSPFPPLPLDRLQGINWPEPEGCTIVVNTIYTVTLAVEALLKATTKVKVAIIACTEALCSKRPFSNDERVYFQELYPMVDFLGITSVHDLIVKFVLPNSAAILILNEAELEHLTGAKVIDERGRGDRRYLGGVFEGLERLRKIQGNQKGKIFFTMGKEGSLCCLDKNNELHYCGITNIPGPIAGKTAIGDVYAGTIMGYEHVKRAIRGEVPNVAYQITAAAAAADVGVAKGFRAVSVLGIDSGILQSWEKYIKLGPLEAVRRKAEQLYGPVSDIRLEDVDWGKISVLSLTDSKLPGPTLLEQDINREWLRPPFPNHVVIQKEERPRDHSKSTETV